LLLGACLQARNRRALQLLLQKDETIKKLTAQLASAEGRAVEQRDAHTRELVGTLAGEGLTFLACLSTPAPPCSLYFLCLSVFFQLV
jgi:hypothetical protein